MKKRTLLGLSILAVGVGSSIAYAKEAPVVKPNTNTGYGYMSQEDMEEMHKTNMKYRKEEMKEYLNKGLVSKEEYNSWTSRMDEMETFRKENGYEGYGYGHMGGGCGGYGRGMGRGMHHGMGRMMY